MRDREEASREETVVPNNSKKPKAAHELADKMIKNQLNQITE